VVEDEFLHPSDDESLPLRGDVVVSLARFRAERDALLAREGQLGVRIPGEADPEELRADLDALALVEIELPRFKDGRAFTTGRLLRERLGFRGEIRAVGYVLRDQIFYLSRCGFDAFELKPNRDPEEALRAFGEMTVTYQPAVDEPLPLWRR
jgi:uncharacterized protein (DUF934 family)